MSQLLSLDCGLRASSRLATETAAADKKYEYTGRFGRADKIRQNKVQRYWAHQTFSKSPPQKIHASSRIMAKDIIDSGIDEITITVDEHSLAHKVAESQMNKNNNHASQSCFAMQNSQDEPRGSQPLPASHH